MENFPVETSLILWSSLNDWSSLVQLMKDGFNFSAGNLKLQNRNMPENRHLERRFKKKKKKKWEAAIQTDLANEAWHM